MADKERTPGTASSNASPDPRTMTSTMTLFLALTRREHAVSQEKAALTFDSDSPLIASSMYDGFVENGRRYQTKREGEYWGPSDAKQWESMQSAHVLCTILDSQRKNNLFRSPLPVTAQILLDVGTGGGTWACDVADRYPSAFVQGVDLFPTPETWVPPNCKFEGDDVLKPWEFKQKFDLIHMRLMLGSFTDNQWKGVYKQAYENLASGGWIEQLEAGMKVYSDDKTLDPEASLSKWDSVIGGAFAASGKPVDTIDHMKTRIEAAGFTNIHEKLYKVPIGKWAKHPILKEAGKFNKMQLIVGLEGFALYILAKFGQPKLWGPDEIQVYLAKVRQDLDNPAIHSYWHIKRVWAQKPYDSEPQAKQ